MIDLVKVTRPGADLERQSVAYRLEQLERRVAASGEPVTTSAPPIAEDPTPPPQRPIELDQLQEAWLRTILPAVEQRSIPTASVLREAQPADLAGDTLTLEFPAAAAFHRQLAEEPKNATLLADALYELTGRRFSLSFSVGENGGDAHESDEGPVSEDEIVQLMKETFNAREVDE